MVSEAHFRRSIDWCVCVFQVIVGHGEPAPRLCNKDPFALKSLSYLSRIFPKAKFVLMLRDGRATVHSMISRKVRRLLALSKRFSLLLFFHDQQSLVSVPVLFGVSSLSLICLLPSSGDHLWLRPYQLQGLPDQVEQRGGDHVQPVPGSRRVQVSARPLRAARASHGR